MNKDKRYYFGALTWSIIQKLLTAIVGFVSTPLLLGYYGKADFGLLAIATSCNGYMQLLDLGMNVGAVRYYSIWLSEGKMSRINNVLRTNLSFYTLVAFVNIAILLAVAWWGESLFSVTHNQFYTLRTCLYVLATFSLFSWLTTAYNQLLIADKQMAFTMKANCVMLLARIALLVSVFVFDLSLVTYFFWLTAIVASLLIPFAIKCIKDKLVKNIIPAFYWEEFKPMLIYSLSILALSLFQMTATQTRPIILSMFAEDGSSSCADFNIIQVFPNLIIMIGSTFTGIFLPKTSEMVARNERTEQERFVYKWTIFTTILANCMCMPMILGANDLLSAYVGKENAYLVPLMVIWIVCTLLQIHSTPTNALILGIGKTKILVYVSAFACLISMIINAMLAPTLSTGSAVIGYAVYIVINLLMYYCYYDIKVLKLSIRRLLHSFLLPTILGAISLGICAYVYRNVTIEVSGVERINYMLSFIVKFLSWAVIYAVLVLVSGIVKVEGKTIITEYDKFSKLNL